MTPPSKHEVSGIYDGIEKLPMMEVDLQGWNSTLPIFRELISEVRPGIVVEAGVWKGASLIHMASVCRDMGLDTLFYAVDVFYGLKGEMLERKPTTSQLPLSWNRPTLYQQFLYNVKAEGFDDRVIPVMQYSAFGADLLAIWGVVADMIYIDADHSRNGCYKDIMQYWNILRPGGLMFGDDYVGYEGVRCAVYDAALHLQIPLKVQGDTWVLRKP